MRILIVDSDPRMRSGIRAALEASGHYELCGEAADGQEAIDKTLRLQPDVILMALNLPGVDGLEATRRILSSFPPAEVIILTGDASPQVAQRVFGAGALGFVVQRPESAELLAAVENASQRKSFMSRTAWISSPDEADNPGRVPQPKRAG